MSIHTSICACILFNFNSASRENTERSFMKLQNFWRFAILDKVTQNLETKMLTFMLKKLRNGVTETVRLWPTIPTSLSKMCFQGNDFQDFKIWSATTCTGKITTGHKIHVNLDVSSDNLNMYTTSNIIL